MQLFAIKIALSSLCSGNIIDKLKYAYSLLLDQNNGYLIVDKFKDYLNQLLLLTSSVRESSSYQNDMNLPASLFDLSQPIDIKMFMDLFLSSSGPPPCLSWFIIFNKLNDVEYVVHETQCMACHRSKFTGFRYKCQKCFNYNLCQDCFWRGRYSGSHSDTHICKEYTYWRSSTKSFRHTLRKSFRCLPTNRKVDYFDECSSNNRINLIASTPTNGQKGGVKQNYSGTSLNNPNYNNTSNLNNCNDTADNSNGEALVHQKNLAPTYSQPYQGTEKNDYSTNNEQLFDHKAFSNRHGQPMLEYKKPSNSDEEHQLIAYYSSKLAKNEYQDLDEINESKILKEISQQHQIIMQLEAKNREIMREINRLRLETDGYFDYENEEELKADMDMAYLKSQLLALRERKDELKNYLIRLDDTRSELKSQLQSLMHVLRNEDNVNIPPYERNQALAHLSTEPFAYTFLPYSNIDEEDYSFSSSSDLEKDLEATTDSMSQAMPCLFKEINSDKEDFICDRVPSTQNLETRSKLKSEFDDYFTKI